MIRTVLVLLLVALGIGAAVLSGLSRTSNCGGNSAALSAVYAYAQIARIEAEDRPDHVFDVTSVTAQTGEELARLPGKSWLRSARFLVLTIPVPLDSAERRIVIVCDTPYRNVPRHWFGSSPATHAAGYSDGSHSLISTAEFAALDRSKFKPLDELYPPRKK
jgi:hypothetical protein